MGDLAIPDDMKIVPLEEADDRLADIGNSDAMMDKERPQFEWISITHHSKKGKFEFPSGEEFEEFVGVVVHKQPVRKYWAENAEMGDAPLCMSLDLVMPVPNAVETQNVVCVSCPQNQWGSTAKGGGKGCKEKRILLVWVKVLNDFFLMSLPSTSLKAWGQYLRQIDRSPKVKSHTSVLTKFALNDKVSKGGYEYRECALTVEGALPTAAAIEFANFGADMAAQMEQIPGEEGTPKVEEEAF